MQLQFLYHFNLTHSGELHSSPKLNQAKKKLIAKKYAASFLSNPNVYIFSNGTVFHPISHILFSNYFATFTIVTELDFQQNRLSKSVVKNWRLRIRWRKLNFLLSGSRESYFGLVCHQNNNNLNRIGSSLTGAFFPTPHICMC